MGAGGGGGGGGSIILWSSTYQLVSSQLPCTRSKKRYNHLLIVICWSAAIGSKVYTCVDRNLIILVIVSLRGRTPPPPLTPSLHPLNLPLVQSHISFRRFFSGSFHA